MPSARHLLLRRRAASLQKNLLPKQPSLTGAYTRRQLDGIAGYFVLVHAEIESYFEDKALELIDASLSRWRTERRYNRPLIAMVAYYAGTRKAPPPTFDPAQYKDRNFDRLVFEAASQHRSRVKMNNGIKEKDLCEMLFPVGFSYTDLDATLVASLDSFGQRRGDFAHQSLHRAVAATQIDPFVEANTVANIVTALTKVDTFFGTLT